MALLPASSASAAPKRKLVDELTIPVREYDPTPPPDRWVLGVAPLASRMLSRGDGLSAEAFGFGASVFLGLRVHKRVMTELSIWGLHHRRQGDMQTIPGYTLGAKYFFRDGHVLPFVQGGVGVASYKVTMSESVSADDYVVGINLEAGGGVDVRLTETVNIGLRSLVRTLPFQGTSAATLELATSVSF